MFDLLGNVSLSVRALILLGFIVVLIAAAGLVVLTGVRRQAGSAASTYEIPARDSKSRTRDAARAAKASAKAAAVKAKSDAKAAKAAARVNSPAPARAAKPEKARAAKPVKEPKVKAAKEPKVKPVKEPKVKPVREPKPAKEPKHVKEPKPAKVKGASAVKGRPSAAAAVIAGPPAGTPIARLVPLSPAAAAEKEASSASQDFAAEFPAAEPRSILDMPSSPAPVSSAAVTPAPRLAPVTFGAPAGDGSDFDIAPDDEDTSAVPVPRIAHPESDFDILAEVAPPAPAAPAASSPSVTSHPFGAPETEESEW